MKVLQKISMLAVSLMLAIFIAVPAMGATIIVPTGQATIQEAIAAANSGDTIQVNAGTYVETGQIVIDNKSVTIVGDINDRPVIKPAQDTASGDKTNDNSGWWLVTSTGHLDLQNVVLDGTGKNIFSAIRGVGTGSVDNCDIRNIKFSKYVGFGIWTLSNWTITNNTFTNMEREGIMAKFSGVTDAVISGNIYYGKGYGDWLDYGIELGAGAVGTLSNNIITNCYGVASDGSTSGAVQITTYYGAGTAGTLTGNYLVNNSAGIAVGYDGADTSTVVAHNNYFLGNPDGAIINTGANTVNAQSNSWGTANAALIAGMVKGNVDTSNPLDVGPQGPQGPIGLTGATGSQGPIGLTGATGSQGPIGLTGATGSQGPIGLTGLQGDPGPAGTSSWADGTGVVSTVQKVGIGTTTPATQIHIVSEGLINSISTMETSSDNSTTKGQLTFKRSRGTISSPTAVLANDYLGVLAVNAHNGSAYEGERGVLLVTTSENWTPTAGGYRFIFKTRSNGTVGAPTERMRIDHDGNVGIGSSAPSEKLEVNGNVKASAFYGDGTHLTGIIGTPGPQGDPGVNGINGTNGISVTATPEPAGANCIAGGVKYTSVDGDTYVCNGEQGSAGTFSAAGITRETCTATTCSCTTGTLVSGGADCGSVAILANFPSSTTEWSATCDGVATPTISILCAP